MQEALREISKMKKRIGLCTLAVLITLSVLVACSKNIVTPLTVAEFLSLGEKYLLELDYEQAVVYFLKAIEVEPMNPRGYMGAAEAYIQMSEPQKAVDILQKGITAVSQENTVLLQAKLDEVAAVLLTQSELVDIPPLPVESDKKDEEKDEKVEKIEETPEQEVLTILRDSPLNYIGASPDDFAATWGAFSNVTRGEDGSLFQYGSIFVAFDRENNGEPDSDGLAYLLFAPLASIVRNDNGGIIRVSALDELFVSSGKTSPGVIQYSYQGINLLLEDVPSNGLVSIDHIVVLSVEPRPPEQKPEQTPPPTQPQSPTSTQPNDNTDLLPIPPIPEDDTYEYIEEEIDLEVLRP